MKRDTAPELQPQAETCYAFKHIDPIGDLDLLHTITLDPSQIEPQWLKQLDRCMRVGSIAMHVTRSTHQETVEVAAARRKFEHMLGITHPRHELFHAYKATAAIKGKHGPRPSVIFATLKELASITGDTSTAVSMATERFVLSASASVLRSHYSYICRLADILGWQGDVRHLVQEKPRVLLLPSKSLFFFGRLALQHAASEQRRMDIDSISRMWSFTTDNHLVAAIRKGEAYKFGQLVKMKQGVKAIREEIYEAVASQDVVEHVGRHVIEAYFRCRLPTAALQLKYPHLQTFIPKSRRVALPEVINVPETLTGNEPWLAQVACKPAHTSPSEGLPSTRKGASLTEWCKEINACIARGSVSMRNRTEAAYDEIWQQRWQFFHMLGWTNRRSIFYPTLQHLISRRPALIPPQYIVNIFNILEAYGVRDIGTLVQSYSKVLECQPDAFKKKLDMILEEGLDVNETLQISLATVVVRSETKLRAQLKRKAMRIQASYPP